MAAMASIAKRVDESVDDSSLEVPMTLRQIHDSLNAAIVAGDFHRVRQIHTSSEFKKMVSERRNSTSMNPLFTPREIEIQYNLLCSNYRHSGHAEILEYYQYELEAHLMTDADIIIAMRTENMILIDRLLRPDCSGEPMYTYSYLNGVNKKTLNYFEVYNIRETIQDEIKRLSDRYTKGPIFSFSNIDEAIDFIRSRPDTIRLISVRTTSLIGEHGHMF